MGAARNNATAVATPRTLSGSALEGATIYLVGGAGATTGSALSSTEQLIW